MSRTSLLTFDNVKNSTKAVSVDRKVLNQLNGYDPAIRKGADLWFLSQTMVVKESTYNGATYNTYYFWALDVVRHELVEVKYTSLKLAMGYTQRPSTGEWGKSDDGKWWILRPMADDPALQSFVRWGIGETLTHAFKDVKVSADSKEIMVTIPYVFRLKITDIDYVTSKSPIDASLLPGIIEEKKKDTSFTPNTTRRWFGVADYPTQQELEEMIKAHNAACPSLQIKDKEKKEWFKIG